MVSRENPRRYFPFTKRLSVTSISVELSWTNPMTHPHETHGRIRRFSPQSRGLGTAAGAQRGIDRREFMTMAAAGLGCLAAGGLFRAISSLKSADDCFLDDLARRNFRFFEESTDPHTGLTLDRNWVNEPYPTAEEPAASLSVTGFSLAAFCIAAERGWIDYSAAQQRVKTTLRFFARRAPHEHGWFYHWMHPRTGQRSGAILGASALSEITTIDTALLLGGVLSARQCFADDDEITDLSAFIYSRVDFPWMLDDSSRLLRHGWTPEAGFVPFFWDNYSEANLLYLLAIGSPSFPIPAGSWYAWNRNINSYGSYTFVGNAPLFIHQYSHAFIDFRGATDDEGSRVNWFHNSTLATRAHRQFCADLSKRFPCYSREVWGITASRSASGYTDWGGPPLDPRIDGTIVPAAPAGSLMFEPDLCIEALRTMYGRFGERVYSRYGFVDSFNPLTGWLSPDVTGLNSGITLLSAENHRSGKLWQWFMANPEPRHAMAITALRPGSIGLRTAG